MILVDTGVVVAMGNRRDEDHKQCTELLVDKYADFPLGTADACVVALAERLGVTRVATLDTRHFSVARPRHVASFELLPLPTPHGRQWPDDRR
ncbi:PIN domain-containing protein [Amycolatopsis alkalitolerans]|uniref:PIN domain-containing protein n=1 Tax=Amycolatopsis alkalitolerans TaxID=2547244 RepID=A0A5C4M0H9_9PSEU|nr:hypothetical protein [Amycolatopsis alkalitolerans]TNC26035.1 hypothetical protein FG385_12705 [Amycolatopsis alkalitolerans]